MTAVLVSCCVGHFAQHPSRTPRHGVKNRVVRRCPRSRHGVPFSLSAASRLQNARLCVLPGERCSQARNIRDTVRRRSRAERRCQGHGVSLLVVVAADTKSAIVKLAQKIDESASDVVGC